MQPLTILKNRGVLTATLRHELAHVIIDAVSNNHAPRWLEEGFAIHLAGEGQMLARNMKRRVLTETEVEQGLEHPQSQDDMRNLYAQAYLIISGLIRNDGEASVWKRLAEAKG